MELGVGRIEPFVAQSLQPWDLSRKKVAERLALEICARRSLARPLPEPLTARPDQVTDQVVVHNDLVRPETREAKRV
jgi:hypothetical protein